MWERPTVSSRHDDMRIAFVSQEYPPETAKGGIGTQTYIKASGMARRGHEVIVISRTNGNQIFRSNADGVSVIRIPGLGSAIHTEIADWVSYSSEVAKAVASLNAEKPLDIVDFPEWGGEGFVHLLNRTEWNFIPTVVQLHGPLAMLAKTIGWPDTNSEFFRVGTLMESTCVRLADAVFSSSRCSAEWCGAQYGIDTEKIPVLHTGVDIELFRPGKAPASKTPTIVFAGKITRNKGVYDLVAAACDLGGDLPDLRVRLIGRGEPQVISELSALARKSGLASLLEFVGFVDRAELPEHLCRGHVFAAPSEYEGGPGFVYLEAMACGIPVIACAGSGAAEVVSPNKTGFLVAPRDVNELSQALRTLLCSLETRLAMGTEARIFVEREANSERCLDKLERFYLETAAQFARKP
jgi:glycosyltransferase involved in cell wall biosynthesis